MTDLSPDIQPKSHHNYVAFFLTLACNLNCPYCLNLHGHGASFRPGEKASLTADEWIRAADRLVLRDDLPLTLQGGEPTLHNGFYRLVNEARKEIKMDLLTNMMFDVKEFISNVPVERFTRDAPYAAIRVSYHPGQNDIDDLIGKTLILRKAGFRVGIYGIEHPDGAVCRLVLNARKKCLKLGLDFRIKEFLGEHSGRLHGTFRYEKCVSGGSTRRCECRTTELIVGPAGYVYRCHADLYKGRNPIAHILDPGFSAEAIEKFRDCSHYGNCNPCDVKVKTDRFQMFGHTSVEIRNVSAPAAAGSREAKSVGAPL